MSKNEYFEQSDIEEQLYTKEKYEQLEISNKKLQLLYDVAQSKLVQTRIDVCTAYLLGHVHALNEAGHEMTINTSELWEHIKDKNTLTIDNLAMYRKYVVKDTETVLEKYDEEGDLE